MTPLTAPPRNAILSARFMLVRTAFAVRMLARIEIYMPMYPARAEENAPKRKATVVRQASSAFPFATWLMALSGRGQRAARLPA